MPPKRSRRSSSISEESMSVTDYNEDSYQSGSSTISTRKRKRVINSKLKLSHCLEILEKLKLARAQDGHGLADYFLKLPSKRIATDYFDVISNPIDITKIQMHLRNDEYDTFENFDNDMELLVTNAKTYHTSSAQEYQDAVMLWHFYEQEKENVANKAEVKAESISGSEGKSRRGRKRVAISIDDGMSDQISLATSDDSRNTSEFSADTCSNPLETFFASIVGQKTDAGKDISPTFTYLPSKSVCRFVYPQYYEVIKEPIDLRLIAQRIKTGVYIGIDDVERDFLLMIKNAKVFNEPKSEVYQDALELHKIVKMKRSEVDSAVKVPSKPKRGRKKKSPAIVTEEYSKLDSPKESDEDSDELENSLENCVELDEELNINISDPRYNQWQLFKTVTGLNFNGNNPSDPFMKLPSKKLYPEYFLEILEPMSILMIKAKIKKNMYKNIDEIVRDFDLVFNNAQQFNVEDSGIYKEAVKLQNLTHMKKQDILNSTQQINQDSPKKTFTTPTKTESITSPVPLRKTRPPMSQDELTQKRLQNLYQSIFNYQENNRFLRDIFMTLPSPDQYPDYYKVIPEPIDLTMIRKKIDERKYGTHMDLVQDLKLMFSNAKHFNEQDSQVYTDAVTLEKLVKKKVKNIGASINSITRNRNKKLLEASLNNSLSIVQPSPVFATPIDYHTPFYRIREIFQTVKEYRDHSNRLLSEPFIKLPSRQDLPEYYEYIRKPIELSTIQHRINNERYLTVEDLMGDLNLMFDNACRFNEPESQIYSDALILQRVALEKKAFLTKDDNFADPPNIQETTQTILETLFQQFYDYVDEDGRFLVDSVNDIDGQIVRRIPIGQYPILPNSIQASSSNSVVNETCRLTLMKIRGDLMRRRYRRMDRLQEDVFAVLKHARQVSGVNSQAYEDAFELQKLFITLRDIHCKRGEIFLTPALNYIEKHLNHDIEAENKERKDIIWIKDEEPSDSEEIEKLKGSGNYRQLNSINRKDCIYEIGDYVKVLVEDKKSTYRVGEVIGIFVPNTDDCISESDDSAQQHDGCVLRVRWFFFPQETEHRPTRRFFEREVLMTNLFETVPMSMVISKCFVIYVKDYRHNKITSFEPEDSFISECKYCPEKHSFKKLKIWAYKKDVKENFVKLNNPINPVRHYSQFPTISNNFETNEYNFIIENFNEFVLQEDRSATEFCIYYDQYVCENGYIVKLGDYVYVKDTDGKLQIVRIDQLWKDIRDGMIYFSGPWFINATDIEHLPTKVFYKKEVFLSSSEPNTHVLTSIVGKCVILCFSDYCEYRPTGYTEDNVYVCEFKYFTDDKVARKLKKGLKKVQLSTKALDDEIFFLSKELIPNKQPSPLLAKCSTEPLKQEYITRLVCMSQTPLFASTSASLNVNNSTNITSNHTNLVSTSHNTTTNSQLNISLNNSNVNNSFNDDDSKDTSVNLDDSVCSMSVASSGTTGNEKKKKPKKPKKKRIGPSGYVLYASEIRKKLLQDTPDARFGDISREVGQLWRNMSQVEKDVYERKASEIKKVMEEAALNKDNNISSTSNEASASTTQTAASALLLNRQQIQQQQQQQQQMAHNPSQLNVSPAGGMSIINRAYIPMQQSPQNNASVNVTGIANINPHQLNSLAMNHHNPHGAQPIQYFQTPTGQLLQFLPSNPGVTSNPAVANQLPTDQQHATASVQLIQQSQCQPPSQQVIYQLSTQQTGPNVMTGGHQPMLMNGGNNSTATISAAQQFMLPSNKLISSPAGAPLQFQQQQQQQIQAVLNAASSSGTTNIAASPQLTMSQPQQQQPQTPSQIYQTFSTPINNNTNITGGVGMNTTTQMNNNQPMANTIMIAQNNNINSTISNVIGQSVPTTPINNGVQQVSQPQFISVPPRPNRVFHSEIYQKYIDRIRRNTPTLSDWNKQLENPITKDAVLDRISSAGGPAAKQSYVNRLVNDVAPQFLGPNVVNSKMTQDQVVEHLFKLRDHMLRDALNIKSKLLSVE